jgi:ParB family transcriptional regulator, chromosome partitioning protein
MATHELKTWPGPFAALWGGIKTFEFRRDDREPRFEAGDVLHLYEFNPETQRHTGRMVAARVPYLLRGPAFGLPEGYVVMSVTDLMRHPMG